jgi:hypothetical protein
MRPARLLGLLKLGVDAYSALAVLGPLIVGVVAPVWIFSAERTRRAAMVAALFAVAVGGLHGLTMRRQTPAAPPPPKAGALLMLVMSVIAFGLVMSLVHRDLEEVIPGIVRIVEFLIELPWLVWILVAGTWAWAIGTAASLITRLLPPPAPREPVDRSR